MSSVKSPPTSGLNESLPSLNNVTLNDEALVNSVRDAYEG